MSYFEPSDSSEPRIAARASACARDESLATAVDEVAVDVEAMARRIDGLQCVAFKDILLIIQRRNVEIFSYFR